MRMQHFIFISFTCVAQRVERILNNSWFVHFVYKEQKLTRDVKRVNSLTCFAGNVCSMSFKPSWSIGWRLIVRAGRVFMYLFTQNKTHLVIIVVNLRCILTVETLLYLTKLVIILIISRIYWKFKVLSYSNKFLGLAHQHQPSRACLYVFSVMIFELGFYLILFVYCTNLRS